MLKKIMLALTVVIAMILSLGSLHAEAQQLPTINFFEKYLQSVTNGVDKSTSSTQSSTHQVNVSYSEDLSTLKVGDELILTVTIKNTTNEPITGFGTIVNLPFSFISGPPVKSTADEIDFIYGYLFSIGDFFGIKDIEFSHGQFYNTPLIGVNKQAGSVNPDESINISHDGYNVGSYDGVPPIFVWLIDPSTKNNMIAPGESAVLELTLIAEMPTDIDFKQVASDNNVNDILDDPFMFNTVIIPFDNFDVYEYQASYSISPPDEDLPPVSFYMTSFGLESSDAGNLAGYYLTIVNRDFSSTLHLDMNATMPKDFFAEFFKTFGYSGPPALGFGSYHSIFSQFYPPFIPVKATHGNQNGDTQLNGYSYYPYFNYRLLQPEGQSDLHLLFEKDDYCILKTTDIDDIECPGIVMPPGIMTIFIQGTPMPNGNGTSMTMEAQLDFIDAYEFYPPPINPPPFPPKAVAAGSIEEHFESLFPLEDSASFDVSPIIVTYDISNDSCPVNGDEIGYTMTVQGIDYPRLPGRFSIYQRVDDKQDVTLVDFQRPNELDPDIPSITEFIMNYGNNGGLWYMYDRLSSFATKSSSESLMDEEFPSPEELVTNYVNTFQVLVNADVSTTENSLATSEARLTHFLDLSYNNIEFGKTVSQASVDHDNFEIPGYIPEGFIFDLIYDTEVEVNCYSDISGVKYLDINGNGTRDGGELGLEGVEIILRNLNNEIVATTVTGSDGSYIIEEVPPAYYALSEVVPAGYAQSEPGSINSLHHNVKAVPGVDLEGLNFGNYQPSSLNVLVFHDYNRNGVKDNDEPLILDWDVRLGQETYQYDKTLSTGEANGALFTDLRPGTYTLSGELPEYWVVTTTEEPLSVDIQNGSTNELMIGRDFDEVSSPDVATAIIRGSVFNDVNADASWHFPGENGLKGRSIQLTGVSEKGVNVNRTTTTDEMGRYEFTQLPPGMFEVRHAASDGISSSWPKSGSHILKLEEGEIMGSWASGAPGGPGWLQAIDAGDDSTPAVMQLVLDLDGDGTGDSYASATGRAELTLAGTTGMEQRPFVVNNVTMYGRDSQGSSILLVTPGISQEGGLLAGSSSVVGQELTFGLIIEIDGEFAYSTGSMSFDGQTDRWPIRNAPARFNTMQGAAAADLRDPFGQLVGRILFAEITPLYGIDFGAEHADFGDAGLQSGTLMVGSDIVPQITSAGLSYPFDGARHTLPIVGANLPVLGAGVTADSDGKPTEMADSDVDDGVVLPQAVAPGASFTAEVTVLGSGKLSAWIDWNNNKLFDAGEKVLDDADVSGDGSPYELTVAVPSGVASGNVFVRFRLSTHAGLGAYGPAADGEVEDYVLTVDGSLAGGGGGQPTNDPDANAGIPTEFRLIGAWPNPFNPTTNISFDLPEAASVRVEVVDMLGRQVMSLAPRTMGSGANRTITLDAAKLSSGVYVYRVVAESATQTFVQGSKFTLVK